MRTLALVLTLAAVTATEFACTAAMRSATMQGAAAGMGAPTRDVAAGTYQLSSVRRVGDNLYAARSSSYSGTIITANCLHDTLGQDGVLMWRDPLYGSWLAWDDGDYPCAVTRVVLDQ